MELKENRKNLEKLILGKCKTGKVLRVSDISNHTNNPSRDLNYLSEKGLLVKAGPGLFYRPKKSPFGKVPASSNELIRAFLKTDDFLMVDFNSYNGLGLGTTQLYTQTVVYNRKRHGEFKLGNKIYRFIVREYPNKLSPEFLLVDMMNNLSKLAEDQNNILDTLVMKWEAKKFNFDKNKVINFAKKYGQVWVKKLFSKLEPQ